MDVMGGVLKLGAHFTTSFYDGV